jgi:excinuclease ABC subunit A
VYVADKNLPSITQLPIKKAADYFEQVQLTGQKADIADKVLKEIRDRLHFLVSVGLDYLSLRTLGRYFIRR